MGQPPPHDLHAPALAELAALVRSREALLREFDRAEYDVLVALRAAGVPWRVIAEVYGTSVQAVRQGFGRLRSRVLGP